MIDPDATRAELVAELDLITRLMRRHRWWNDAFYSADEPAIEDVRRIEDGLQARCVELMRGLFGKPPESPAAATELPPRARVRHGAQHGTVQAVTDAGVLVQLDNGYGALVPAGELELLPPPEIAAQISKAYDAAVAVGEKSVHEPPPTAEAKIARRRPSEDDWRCPTCDHVERIKLTRCSQCGESRPSADQFLATATMRQLARDVMDACHPPSGDHWTTAENVQRMYVRARKLAEFILGEET